MKTLVLNFRWQVLLACGFCLACADENAPTNVTCAVCTSNSLQECQDSHDTCVYHRCYYGEVLRNGQQQYLMDCDNNGHCTMSPSKFGPGALKLECCDSGDNCNLVSNPANVVYSKDMSHQNQHHMSSTTSTTTPVPTPAPYFLNKGLRCEVCSGELCGIIPGNDAVLTCPDPFPYCMNTVENDINGNKITSKRCASQRDCQTQWWESSSRQQECVKFDPSEVYIQAFSCHFCCLTDLCNRYIHPMEETLFRGV